MIDKTELTFITKHFVLNISRRVEDNGLVLVQRDPRQDKVKRPVYVGTVEEVAEDCTLVKSGDKVVVERFTWMQTDIDDERIIACEKDLLLLANDVPAPKVILFKLIEKKAPTTTLALPASFEIPETPSYCGEVIGTYDQERFAIGEIYWVQKSDNGQFRYGEDKLAFRNNGYAEILARGWSPEYRRKRAEELGIDQEEMDTIALASGFVSVE